RRQAVVVDEGGEDRAQGDPGYVAGRRIAAKGWLVGLLMGGLVAGGDGEDPSRSEMNGGGEGRVKADAAITVPVVSEPHRREEERKRRRGQHVVDRQPGPG